MSWDNEELYGCNQGFGEWSNDWDYEDYRYGGYRRRGLLGIL